jgi:hypothetical protein
MRFFTAYSRSVLTLIALSTFLTTVSPNCFAETTAALANDRASSVSSEQTSSGPGDGKDSAAVANDGAPSAAPEQAVSKSSDSTDSAASASSAANTPVDASASSAVSTPVQPGAASEPAKVSAGTGLESTVENKLLKGKVAQEGKKSPFISGTVQSIPKGTNIEINMCGNINSEVSQKGDEVLVQIAHDIGAGKGVQVPGGWFMHGLVTDAASQRRGGRNGFVQVEFDKLVTEDGQYEVPFHATFSTKDKLLKSIAKVAAIDAGIMSYGAVGGAILSVQLTGLPTAIATHGISVGIGAGAGALVGAIGAAKRKGKIASFSPGDAMKLITVDSISLPRIDKTAIPSGKAPHEQLKDMLLYVNKASFRRDPNGDRESNLLTVDLTMANKTAKEYTFFDLAVVSDHNQRFFPSIFGGFQQLQKKVKPNSKEDGIVTFEVESKKQKYWLVLLDKGKENELKRVPIN